MAIRNILDYQGNVIGQMEMPDGTSEEVWQAKLAPYAVAPAVPKIPDVTPRQFRQALVITQALSIAQIEAALNALPEPTKSLAWIEWEYSIAFKRDNPLVNQVAGLLGWTSEQLDDLWKFAAGL